MRANHGRGGALPGQTSEVARGWGRPDARASGRQGLRHWLALGLLPSLVAASLAALALVAGPLASPSAAATAPARLCSGAGVSGFLNGPDQVPFRLFVPHGATYSVVGTVDLPLPRDGTHGYDALFIIDNLVAQGVGDYWNGPNYNWPFSGSQTNNDAARDIDLTVHQGTGGYIAWRFTVTVTGGGSPAPARHQRRANPWARTAPRNTWRRHRAARQTPSTRPPATSRSPSPTSRFLGAAPVWS